MAYIYIDAAEDGRIKVQVLTGIKGDKTTMFPAGQRAEAERFAESKMGRKGCVMSTLDMTPDQLAAHLAREARIRAAIAKIGVAPVLHESPPCMGHSRPLGGAA